MVKIQTDMLEVLSATSLVLLRYLAGGPVSCFRGATDDSVLDPQQAPTAGTDDDQRIGRRARDGPHHAGRNILPLEREGLISIVPGRIDRLSKELKLTDTGLQRPLAAGKGWSGAQKRFASIFGGERTVKLRSLLREVSATDPPTVPAANA